MKSLPNPPGLQKPGFLKRIVKLRHSTLMRLMAAIYVRLLRRIYTYRELSRMLGISYHSLARYGTLQTLPNPATAKKILALAKDASGLIKHPNGHVSEPAVVLSNALSMMDAIDRRNVQSIAVAEDNPPPEAFILSMLTARPVVLPVKKRRKDRSYLNIQLEIDGYVEDLYYPKNTIAKKQTVFVVKDGKTAKALRRLGYDAITPPA